ncbi:hypothetical protein ACFOY2_46045 [Nonomuraea purpurea]|uniref:IrrE N-terminal-like domain-containing protein n=1 Tax=Nonomuraea purpurea TaxID=1849276 RepID=A0ABV8GNP9_9ACTN
MLARFRLPSPVRTALDAVRPPRPFNEATYLARVEAYRGRPLRLHEEDLPLDVCGMWRLNGGVDHIHVPRGAVGAQRWQIIGHEVGHMLMAKPGRNLGHGLHDEDRNDLARLLPDLDPERLAMYRLRTKYDEEEERMAELYGTYAVAGVEPDEPGIGRIGRIRQAMDGL